MIDPRQSPDDSTSLVARTWPTVGAPVLIVPLGSTEQHGAHLPLDTDTSIAVVVAEALAARAKAAGEDAVVAPAVAYGSSGEHQDFAGTISIGTAALELMLIELGRSASHWARRTVFVNGHGGNLEALIAAVRVLRSEQRDAAWLPCAPDNGEPHDAHAGHLETSLALHLRPSLVRTNRVEPGATEPIGELLPRLRAGGVRSVSPNGVLGNPTTATAAEGDRLLTAVLEASWRRFIGGVASDGRLVSGGATDA